jgi:predicted ATPase
VQSFELLERECELQVLSALANAACRGSGQLAVVEGPAGIGKTRLLAASRAEADLMSMRVMGARGSQLEREFAYGMVRQLFESTIISLNEAERTELLSGAAEGAARLFAQIDATVGVPAGGDASFATLHGLFWLTANLCAQQPLMLVMDDLHWADTPSLRYLAYLLPRLEGIPLYVLAGLRPVESNADYYLLNLITADPACRLLRPALLSPTGTSMLLSAIFDRAPEPGFVNACQVATRGNPLLLGELAGAMAANGLEPINANVTRVQQIGSQALSRRIMAELERL